VRVVLDTNVLISGVFWRERPGVVLEYWVEGRFVLCASQGIMEEYFEVLDRVGARMDRRDLSDRWKAYLFEHIEVVESPASDEFCRDPDDVPFLDCAICVGADYIVSGDEDLLSLQRVQSTRIVTISALIDLLDVSDPH